MPLSGRVLSWVGAHCSGHSQKELETCGASKFLSVPFSFSAGCEPKTDWLKETRDWRTRKKKKSQNEDFKIGKERDVFGSVRLVEREASELEVLLIYPDISCIQPSPFKFPNTH